MILHVCLHRDVDEPLEPEVSPIVRSMPIAAPAPAPLPAPAAPIASVPMFGGLFGPKSSLDGAGLSVWGTGLSGLPATGHAVAPTLGFGPSPVVPVDAPPPASVAAAPALQLSTCLWSYRDPQGVVQGPFATKEMREWYEAGYFQPGLPVRGVSSRYVVLRCRVCFGMFKCLLWQVRLENGAFIPLSTMFPDPRVAFTFIPDVSLPTAAPAPPSQLQLITDEHARVSAQAVQLERETEVLKKLGVDVSQLFNHHHALHQQAKAANQIESALQLQNLSSQYYNQLNTIHVDVSAKLKTLGQMRAHLQGLETQMRQLLASSAPASGSMAAAVKAEQAAKVEQQRAAAAAAAEQQQRAAAAAAEQQRAAAMAVAAEQQRAAAAAAEQQRAAAVAAAAEQQRAAEQAQRAAKEASDRETQALAEKSRASAVAWSSIAAPKVTLASVTLATAVVEASVEPVRAAVPVVVEVPNPSRPSLLEQQTVEAARKLGIIAAKPRSVPQEDSSVPAEPPVPSSWSAAAPKAAPSKSMAQIQVGRHP